MTSSGTDASVQATPRSAEQWLQRISAVHREKATPEMMEALRRSSDRSRHAELMHRRASRVQQASSVASAVFRSSLSAVDAMASTPGPVRSLMRARSMEATSAMTALSSPAIMSPMSPMVDNTTMMVSMDDEEVEEERRTNALRHVVEQQVQSGTLDHASAMAALSGGDAGGPADELSLDAALKQLEKEPLDETEVASKFELFTGFQKLTEKSRNATMELWSNVKSDFDDAPSVQRKLEKDIKSIDGERNMGIVDDPNRWFVHSMCKTAARNQRQIDGVLKGVTAKLELLASQTQCPICFEDFHSADRPAITLGCAHKACQECWTHWSTVGGGQHAPCPLCRHTEFLGGLFRAAGVDDPPELQ